MTNRRSFFGALAGLFAGFGVAGASAPGGAADLEAHDDIYALSASGRLMACEWYESQVDSGSRVDWLYVRGGRWLGYPSLGDSWTGGRKVNGIAVETVDMRNSNLRYTIYSISERLNDEQETQ